MTSGSKSFFKAERYGLAAMRVGETKSFPDVTKTEHERIKRSAHNYNARTDMSFLTRSREGVLYVTRVK